MLVHVTRFTAVQRQVAEQLTILLKDAQRRLQFGEGEAPERLVDELEALWRDDFEPTMETIDAPDCEPIAWREVQSHLVEAVLKIETKQINGSIKDILDYSDNRAQGVSVIIVGGDKLSRGLTLEGLSVSYFLRASKMYDTLMQMGRWFGYRPGYIDLCRLYTSPELIEWYEHITVANEELRCLFDRMVDEGGNPTDFGMRVRSHSDLLITGQVKMKNGYTVALSFAGDISETIAFHRDEATVRHNFEATERFLASLKPPEAYRDKKKEAVLWKGIPASSVVDDFLLNVKAHDGR